MQRRLQPPLIHEGATRTGAHFTDRPPRTGDKRLFTDQPFITAKDAGVSLNRIKHSTPPRQQDRGGTSPPLPPIVGAVHGAEATGALFQRPPSRTYCVPTCRPAPPTPTPTRSLTGGISMPPKADRGATVSGFYAALDSVGKHLGARKPAPRQGTPLTTPLRTGQPYP